MERRKGLGHERRRADVDLKAAPAQFFWHLPKHAFDFQDDIRDAIQIFIGLRGQANHEVELDGGRAALKRIADAPQNLLFGNIFIDDVPQPLCPGFGRKGKALFAGALHTLRIFLLEGIHPQRGQRDTHALLLELVKQPIRQLLYAAVVSRAQRRKRDFLIACAVDQLPRLLAQRLHALLPHRPVDEPRLAEPAAPGAPAENLQRNPVVHNADIWNNQLVRKIGRIHIQKKALAHGQVFSPDLCNRPILPVGKLHQRGDIDALNARRLLQKFLFAENLLFMRRIEIQQFHIDLLSLADDEQIDKIRQRLWVIGAGSSGYDERIALVSLPASQRDARKLHHAQYSRVAHLIGEVKTDDIKFAGRGICFQRKKRNPLFFHLLLHIREGGIGPLRIGVLSLVGQMIQNNAPKVRHPHLVNIWKSEQKADRHIRPLSGNRRAFRPAAFFRQTPRQTRHAPPVYKLFLYYNIISAKGQTLRRSFAISRSFSPLPRESA